MKIRIEWERGDYVAWDDPLGRTLAGEVLGPDSDRGGWVAVRRVDGVFDRVLSGPLREATHRDWLDATRNLLGEGA